MNENFRIIVNMMQPDGSLMVDALKEVLLPGGSCNTNLFQNASGPHNSEHHSGCKEFNVTLPEGCERGLETLISMCGEPHVIEKEDTIEYILEM